VTGLPPHIVGQFENLLGFVERPDGTYLVFDQRGHTIYVIDADVETVTALVEIWQEEGRIIQPRGLDLGPDGSFVVADAPRGVERIQTFGPDGRRRAGFSLPGRVTPSVADDTRFVLSGVGSVQVEDRTLLVSLQESQSLFTVRSADGRNAASGDCVALAMRTTATCTWP
jgi:DNA-binding beta-propeller fold protein YncE